MSKSVDERIVSMQFDNRQFEKEVATTMSTLDKLKQKLSFKKTANELDVLSKAASKTNMGHLTKSIDTVKVQFSAMQIAGVTALANITNAAVNAGKRMAKALTIDPISTGFSEYETKINAIQVIKANTRGKNTMEDITKALDELNEYADKTIYNFAQMTDNIGKFTAQGLDVKEAAQAVKGLANLAGASGATPQDMARATYQMSQALSGVIRAMDWNSLRNANMATTELKNTLISLAKVHNIEYDKMIEKHGTFEQTLQEGWLTGEMFTEAMNIYSDVYSEAELKAKGFNDAQVKNFKDLAKMAKDATTDVKTYTQLWDVLKETAQSGWTKTWEIIFGDFEGAKSLFSNIYKTLSPIIERMSDARNAMLEKVLLNTASPKILNKWKKLSKTVEKAGVKVSEFQNELIETAKTHGIKIDDMIKESGSFEKSLKKGWLTSNLVIETLKRMAGGAKTVGKAQDDLNKKLKTFQGIVDRVWLGDFGNGKDRVGALTKAGYDYYKIQSLVNKCVDGYKLKLEDLSDSQLKAIGYTEKEIGAIKKLADEAEKSGKPLNELIKSLERPSGKQLLFESFANIFKAIQKPLEAIGKAWEKMFPKEDREETLYKLIENFHKLTEAMIISDDAAEGFSKVAEGLFAAFQLLNATIGKSLLTGIKLLGAVLNLFGTNLLEEAGRIADYIIKLKEWVDSNTLAIGSINKLALIIKAVIDGVEKCVVAFAKLQLVADVINFVKQTIKDFFDSFKIDSKEFGIDAEGIAAAITEMFTVLEGWIESIDKYVKFDDIKKAFSDFITWINENISSIDFSAIKKEFEEIKKIFKTFYSKIEKYFPDIVAIFEKLKETGSGLFEEFKKIGTFVIQGLTSGLKNGLSTLLSTIADVVGGVIKFTKELLGIHSPSLVFYEIGGYLMQGFANGIAGSTSLLGNAISNAVSLVVNFFKNGGLDEETSKNLGTDRLSDISDKFKEFTEKIKETIMSIDLKWIKEKLQMVIPAGIIIYIAKKFNDIIKVFSGAVEGFGDIAKNFAKIEKEFAGILNDFRQNLAGQSFAAKAKGIKDIAIAIAILVGSVVILSKVDSNALYPAIGALAVLIMLMGALAFAISRLSMSKKEVLSIAAVIVGLSFALSIMGATMWLLSNINWEKGIFGVGYMAAFLAAIIGLFFFIKKTKINLTKTDKITALGKILTKLALALLVAAVAIKLMSTVKEEQLGSVVAIFGMFALLFTAAGILVAVAPKAKMDAFNDLVFKMSLSLLLLAVTCKLAGLINPTDFGNVTTLGLLFIGFVAAIVAVTKITKDKEIAQVGKIIFNLAIAMGILALVVKILGSIKFFPNMVRGLVGITFLASLVVALVIVTQVIEKDAAKVGLALMALSLGISVLAGIAIVLGIIPFKNLAKGILAVGMLSLMMKLMIEATRGANDVKATITALAVSIGVMAVAIIALSLLDPTRAAVATAALASVMGMFALMENQSKNLTSSAKNLIIMSAVIGLLAFALYKLAGLEVDRTLASSAALSVLLLSFMASMQILQNGDGAKLDASILGKILIMGGIMLALAGVLFLIKDLPVQSTLANAAALSGLLLSLTAACAILSKKEIDVGSATKAALALSVFIGILAGVMVVIGGLIQGLELGDALDAAISTLSKVGTAIGSFFGGIIKGFGQEVLQLIPKVGEALTGFMDNLEGFIKGASSIKKDAMLGVKYLAETVLILTAASILDGFMKLGSFGLGGSSMKKFAKDLPILGKGLNNFAKNLGEFGDDKAKTIKCGADAVKNLAQAAKEIPNEGGWLAKIVGDNSIDKFGSYLPNLGTHISKFVENLGSFDESKIPVVKAAGSVIATLAKSAKSIPNEGGWLSKIVGENSIDKFGSYLPNLGLHVAGFINSLGPMDNFNVGAVESAGKVISILAEAAKTIPNEGGWLAKIVGENSIDTFGSYLPNLGTHIANFATNIGSMDEGKALAVTFGAKAIKTLAEAAKELPPKGGWMSKIVGESSIEELGKKLPGLGTNLKDFAKNLGTFDDGKIKTIRSAMQVIKGISSLGSVDIYETISHLINLGDVLKTFSKDIKTVCDNLVKIGVEKADKARQVLNSIIGILSSVNIDGEKVKNFSTAMTNAGSEGLENFVKALSGENAVANIKNAVKSVFTNFTKGIKDNKSKATKAMSSAVNSVIKTITNKYQKFYDAGKYVVEGFVKGINEYAYLGAVAGTSLGDSALNAAKRALDERSPSKAFYKVGAYGGEGFVNGLNKYESTSYKAGYSMADSSRKGLSKAMQKVYDILNFDMDTQPTIRPVLDLSDVTQGANSINGLFDMQPNVGVMSNVKAISSMANSRIQNGTNNDVISAINELKGSLGNTSSNNITIGGITYDDGSSIAEAVKALVRAAKVERRV